MTITTLQKQKEEAEKAIKELEQKTKLNFLERRHYKKQLQKAKETTQKLRKQAEKSEQEERKVCDFIIERLMEIHGEKGKEGILDIIDDDGKEITRKKLEQKNTEWLIDTWEGALNELQKIVGSRDYEDKIDYKEGHT